MMVTKGPAAKKEYFLNTYFVLKKAGLHKQAKTLREKFLKLTDIDVAKEPPASNTKWNLKYHVMDL